MARKVTGHICILCLRPIRGREKIIRLDTEDGRVRGGYLVCERPINWDFPRGDTCADVLARQHPDRELEDEPERERYVPPPRAPRAPPPPIKRRRMRTAKERRG